jgi:GMP synthase (glutamine-hydrolysing)
MTVSTADPLRLLVMDAYAPEGRAALRSAGATEAGTLYERMLRRVVETVASAPAPVVDVAHPADADPGLRDGVSLADYDGIAWTGSSLTIHDEGDPRVRGQVELARMAYEAGVPSFGSCWAAQLAVVAAGGGCAANPRGREFGVGRKIALTDEGVGHPLFRGKPRVFDAFTSHGDEVVSLPPGGTLLASNGFSRVQAVAVESGRGSFWAVQYHPEYDLHEVARLCVVRSEELVAQGNFRDRADAEGWVDALETLHRDPSRTDIAFRFGIDRELLDEGQRDAEVRNWLESQVLPHAARRR